MEEIWWRQVTNARKFREEIQDEIFDLHSIVIQIPEKLQWYEEMQEMVREELHNRESERLLERIDDSGESMEPGELDISVITTPDSRWNNYYLEGLDWMIKNLGLDGVYIDDSALDHQTLQRARRVMDADGKRRLIDIHSWNHMNQWAGYANSLHLYLELLPYVDRTWIGEGFPANNTLDFWLVEMSGIPFGLMSETLDARNVFRGMVYGMLSRLPWSGNPVPFWHIWDDFGMKNAVMRGYWDERCPVKTDNTNIPATVYINGDKALVVLANWTDLPQTAKITLDEQLLGFKPSSYLLPEIRNTQWEGKLSSLNQCEIMGRGGMIILLEK